MTPDDALDMLVEIAAHATSADAEQFGAIDDLHLLAPLTLYLSEWLDRDADDDVCTHLCEAVMPTFGAVSVPHKRVCAECMATVMHHPDGPCIACGSVDGRPLWVHLDPVTLLVGSVCTTCIPPTMKGTPA